MNRLQKKVAVITGGNSGIGLATAKEFINEGAKVVIRGRNAASVNMAIEELGTNAAGIIPDTANMQVIKQLQAKVAALFPKIDVRLYMNKNLMQYQNIYHSFEVPGFLRMS